MKDKSIKAIFWAMVAFFVITIGIMLIGVPLARNLNFPLINIFLPCIAIYLILGVILLVLTVKKKVKGTIKKFLLLTGSSAAGLPVFAVLHNIVSGLFDIEEAVFFILATLVCPLGFLVGVVGTIVLAIKNKPTVPTGTS